MKRVTSIVVGLLVLLLTLMVLVPYLYQDEIKEMLKKELNASVNAKVDFDDLSLSLFKSFPDLNIEISDLLIATVDTSSLDTIAFAKELQLDLDVMSVIRKEETVLINGIHLVEPILNLAVDADGNANFDIIKSSDVDEPTKTHNESYRIKLSAYSIQNASFSYLDHQSKMVVDLPEFNHSGKASYMDDILTLATTSTAKRADLLMSGTKYLRQADINLALDLLIDLQKNEYSIDKADLKINELLVTTKGLVDVNDEDIDMDLTVRAPGNDFRELWSVIPVDFKGDLDDLQAKGDFSLDGTIKGKYNATTGVLPVIDMTVNASNGAVNYSALPQALHNIEADVQLTLNGSHGPQQVNIRQLDFAAGKSTFSSKAELGDKNGLQHLSGMLKSNLDMNDLPLEDDIRGVVNADLVFDGFMNDIVNQVYDNFVLSGTASLEDVKVQMDDMPLVQIDADDLVFSPKKVSTNTVTLLLGKSDFQGRLEIIDPLGFIVPDLKPKLYLDGKGSLLDADEWLEGSSDSGGEASVAQSDVTSDLLPFGLELYSNLNIEEIRYGEYILKEVNGKVAIVDQNVVIPSATFNYAGNDLSLAMDLKDVSDYIYRSEKLKGNIQVKGQEFDLDRYMSDSESEVVLADNTETTEMETVILPKDMDLDIDVNFAMVPYGNIEMKNVQGQLALNEQQLDLSNVVADVFGGKMKLIGSFLSNGIEPAAFNIKYDVIKLPFEGVYSNVLTIQRLSPLAEYIKGIFNSTFVVSGKLMDDMMPELGSLTASGYIETIEGQLAQLPFIDKLGKALAVSELAGLAIEDSKNWFEIKNGEFIIEPFDFDYKGISLKASGKTSLDKTMEMDVVLDVPKEMIEKLPGSNVLDRGLSWTQNEASKLGLQINDVKSFKFGVDLVGQITDPDIKVKLLGAGDKTMKERLGDERKQLEKVVRDTLEKEKEKLVNEAREKVSEKTEELKDTVTKRINEESKKVVDKAKEEARKKLNEVIDSSTNKKVVDELEKKAEEIIGDDEKIDQLKKKLEDFNPFKKKK